MSTILVDSFSLAGGPQAVMHHLIATVDDFAHLGDARIACVFSQRTPMLRGSPCWAFIGQPHVQGPFAQLFDWMLSRLCAPLFGEDLPDFIIVFDEAVWPSLDDEGQERLVYHELCHAVVREDEYGVPKISKEDGRLLLRLVPHDYEFFDREVRRYGPGTCGLDGAALAIADGYRAEQRSKRSAA